MRTAPNLPTQTNAPTATAAPTNVSVKTLTFDGAAGTGAVGAVPLFTVTGIVEVEFIIGRATTTLAGATATLALGVTGSTALFIAATTATTITSGTIWATTTPTANGIAFAATEKGIAINNNIIGTVATAAVSSGVLEVTVIWRALSAGATVVAA